MNDLQGSNASSVTVAGPAVRLSKFEVRFDAFSSVQSKSLYGNGRMQVRVMVFAEGEDADGNPVPLAYYPDLLTLKLIQYRDGRPLRDGWTVSSIENEYTHDMPGGSQAALASKVSTQSLATRPVEFWVSSNRAESLDIAAEITVAGKVFRTNNTANPVGDRYDSAVTLIAVPPVTYTVEQFSWVPQRVGGELDGDVIYRYQLGLYLSAKQVRLLSWTSTQYAPHYPPVEFCSSGDLGSGKSIRHFMGVFPAVHVSRVDVNLPGGASHHYYLPVNQNRGELTVVLGQSTKYYDNARVRREPYRFSIIDEYGNEHRLMIGINLTNANFTLLRG
jgi:hypothetical protein